MYVCLYAYLNRYFATEMLAFNAITLAQAQMDNFLSLYYSVAIKQIAKLEMHISSKSIMMIWLLFFKCATVAKFQLSNIEP